VTKRIGRPPIDVTCRSVAVSTRITTNDLDALCVRAIRAGRSVSAQLRYELRRSRIESAEKTSDSGNRDD
jgi:hypothetical protein